MDERERAAWLADHLPIIANSGRDVDIVIAALRAYAAAGPVLGHQQRDGNEANSAPSDAGRPATERNRGLPNSIASSTSHQSDTDGDDVPVGAGGSGPPPVLSVPLSVEQVRELYAFMSMFNEEEFASLTIHIGNGHSGLGLDSSVANRGR